MAKTLTELILDINRIQCKSTFFKPLSYSSSNIPLTVNGKQVNVELTDKGENGNYQIEITIKEL